MSGVDDPFVQYYAAASESEATALRFRATRDLVRGVLGRMGRAGQSLDVADIGCGAGTQCLLWARDGHRLHGIDINEALVSIARERAERARIAMDLQVGTATALPWASASMDVCLVPELLEHVANWDECLTECLRILRPGGLLYVSTTNALCPVQAEFDLPLYSWYPAPLKRYFERRSVTDWPSLVNHARYPAVNWFTYGSLKRWLEPRGFECRDRFQSIGSEGRSFPARAVIGLLKAVAPLRWLGQFGTPYSLVIAVKRQVAA